MTKTIGKETRKKKGYPEVSLSLEDFFIKEIIKQKLNETINIIEPKIIGFKIFLNGKAHTFN